MLSDCIGEIIGCYLIGKTNRIISCDKGDTFKIKNRNRLERYNR